MFYYRKIFFVHITVYTVYLLQRQKIAFAGLTETRVKGNHAPMDIPTKKVVNAYIQSDMGFPIPNLYVFLTSMLQRLIKLMIFSRDRHANATLSLNSQKTETYS